MSNWGTGIRTVLRGLGRNPGFAGQAVAAIALAVIGVAAVYPLLHGIVLRPLPFEEPERIVTVRTALEEQLLGVTAPELTLLSGETELFDAVAAVIPPQYEVSFTRTDVLPRERLRSIQVTPGFFDLLGVDIRGPGFDPAGGTEVMLGHRFWEDRFAADPSVIGRSLSLNGQPYTIVGILPERFEFPLSAQPFDVWIAHRIDPSLAASTDFRSYRIAARLAEGASVSAVADRVPALLAAFHEAHATGIFIRRTEVRTLHEDLVGDLRTPLVLLTAAALLVLVVASLNVALLLSARNLARGTELAVRRALGAGRGRLVRLLLGEAGVIAVLGGALGMAGAGAILWWVADFELLRAADASGFLRAATVAGALAVVMLAAVLPAERAARSATLGERSSGSGRGARRIIAWIVGAECALVFGLLVAGGLTLVSLEALSRVDPGFESRGALALEVRLPRHYERSEIPAFFETAGERLAGLPGVEAVGSVTHLPLDTENWGGLFAVQGLPGQSAETLPFVDWEFASPGYFEAAGIPVLEGRPFSSSDAEGAPLVAIINETLARRYWPDGGALGARVNGNGFDGTWFTVVGVVADVKQQRLEDGSRGYIYMSSLQSFVWPERFFVIRTESPDPLPVSSAARNALFELEPLLTIGSAFPLDDIVERARAPFELRALIFGALGLIGILIGAAGIYGIATHSVQMRRHEVGLRLAVGAPGRRILSMMLVDGLRPVFLGMLGGLVLAWIAGRWLESVLYGIRSDNLAVMGAVAVLLALVAGVAVLPAALRARRTDPVRLLRQD
jgi:putative ABC transport system permease protein